MRRRFAAAKRKYPKLRRVLVQRLRTAGAILLGSTNTPEFLMAYETDNLLAGKTSNPWNDEYSSADQAEAKQRDRVRVFRWRSWQRRWRSIRVRHTLRNLRTEADARRIPSKGHYPAGNSAFGWLGAVGPMARTVSDLKSYSTFCADLTQATRSRFLCQLSTTRRCVLKM